MLSGTTFTSPFSRTLGLERTKSGRVPGLDAPKSLSSLKRKASLDSNCETRFETAICSTRGSSEAAEPVVREADAEGLTYIPLQHRQNFGLAPRLLGLNKDTSKSLIQRAATLQPALLQSLCMSNFLQASEKPSSEFLLEAVKTEQAPTQPPPVKDQRPPPDPKKREDFYANVGEAIRVLRAEIPTLFQKDLTYGIYREDIAFRDPRNCFHGLKDYKTIFWSLRFHGRLFFKMLYVDVLRIWESPKNPTDAGTILKMRWSVHGIPRVPWDAEGVFDGISTFKLDSSGKIYEHEVNNVILRDPPKQGNPFLAGLNLIPVPQQQRIPCPGAWFQAAQKQPEEMNGVQ